MKLSLRYVLVLFSSLKDPLRRLLLVWRYLKRCLGPGKPRSRGNRKESELGRGIGEEDRKNLEWRGTRTPAQDGQSEVFNICASRRPGSPGGLSALGLHLDHPHGQFLQPTDIPGSRPPSIAIESGQSPAHSVVEMPYSYAHSNNSRSSDLSIGGQSSGEPHRGRRLEVARARPDARPTSRAAARGTSRVAVASRAPSPARSRSGSRAPSRSPLSSIIGLPFITTAPPTPTPTNGSQPTLAVPDASVVHPTTPEAVPSIVLPDEGPDIYPVLEIPRYDNCPTVPPDDKEWTLDPVTTQFHLDNVPSGWTPCTHPDGRLYFYDTRRRIYTDNDVRIAKILDTLETFARQLDEMVRKSELSLPENHDLVLFLENRTTMPGSNWLYYYADHATHTLFWIQPCSLPSALEVTEVKAICGPYDMKYEIESKYWQHIEMYPFGHSIPDAVYTEINGMLVFASTDATTSLTTTVPYCPDDVHRMIAHVKAAQAVDKTDYATAVVGRLMSIWYHNRFLNFHGQTHARLNRNQTVYNRPAPRRTPLIKILSPLFWNAPDVHLKGLETIWTDNVIIIIPWSGFISKLLGEWQEFVLYATVLLNANVAFLAIPIVTDGKVTLAQISSYLSTLASIGCILIGLLLIRQHRVKPKDTAEEANKYLSSRDHKMLGLETLAIIYSLPYALLMWGMVTFLLAFSFECFDTRNKAASAITATVWIAVALLVCWTILTGWDGSDEASQDAPQQMMEKPLSLENDVHSSGATDTVATQGRPKRKWWMPIFGRCALSHPGDPQVLVTEMHNVSSV
ncbi:hypothetical protein C8Q74DRAFT_1208734 [Fomes fomentarius]|nr:hypothetical protein C8Q74DRAFT_1208734 [Fomes fomentarius]